MKKSIGQKRPLSKKTVALLEQLSRRRGTRKLSRRFLIVCEDEKSAVHYFKAFRKHYGIDATSVRITGSGGRTQPIQVVDKAIELKSQAESANSGTEPFEEVWCIIDGDFGTKIINARARANAEGIKLAVSTKCFEYWILLHFSESDTATHNCDETIRLLEKGKHITKYEKGNYDFKLVVPDAPVASLRAEKLRKPGILRGELPENQNPCSEVYLLVNALIE